MSEQGNRRVLLIDDNPGIHEDFRKILGATEAQSSVDDARAAFFGDAAPATTKPRKHEFDLTSALQGREGYEAVQTAREAAAPFALAFVDVRMPPGWDGIETVQKIWEVDSEIQIVICTAFSDYSYEEIVERLGQTDRLLILKKPFDPIEVCQLAASLTEKWNVTDRALRTMVDLQRAEQEARSYAISLETLNRALETSKAAADRASELKSAFLLSLTQELRNRLSSMISRIVSGGPSAADEPELEALIHSSEQLVSMLDQIMDLSRIESGQSSLQSVSCSPFALIDDLAEKMRPLANQRGLDVETSFVGAIPNQIEADVERVSLILRYLLEHAIETSEQGPIEVSVQLDQSRDWRHPQLVFGVTDRAPALSVEVVGRMFDGDFAQELEGGLEICMSKRLAQLLGGDVVGESDEDGNTFSLVIDAGTLDNADLVDSNDSASLIDGDLPI